MRQFILVFKGKLSGCLFRRPVFEKPWAFLRSLFSDDLMAFDDVPSLSKKVPRLSARRCASDASKLDHVGDAYPKMEMFFFLGISRMNQKSIYTSESYIINKNHLTLFLADSMSFIFKMLFFCGVPSILLLLEEFLFSKPFRGFPFAKMRMGTEGFTRCKPQPGEKSLLSKVDERFQNGNWRLATRQMRA